MNSEQFVISFNNAVYITLVGTTVNMVLTSLMAYGLSKPWLGGRRVLNFMVLFTMLFGEELSRLIWLSKACIC